jgi:hypothetical protein
MTERYASVARSSSGSGRENPSNKMTREEFGKLKVGDIVRHVDSIESAVVTEVDGERVIAVRNYELTNPEEWKLIAPLAHKIEEGQKIGFEGMPKLK